MGCSYTELDSIMLCNYLADDDPCKAVGGNCQPVDTHCGGEFRVGLCPGLPTRCCVPQGKSICALLFISFIE